MIPRIVWVQQGSGQAVSPFLRGKTERPLKITFHTSSFAGASMEEREAIEVLRQLSNLPEIEAIDTESGSLPHLKIGAFENGDDIPVTVTSQNGEVRSWISWLNRLPQIAAQLVGQNDPLHPEAQAMLADLLIAQAHCQVRHDIFITLSPQLLSHRAKDFIREISPRPSEVEQTFVNESNPRTPSEAAQIVGLFLRTRGNYTWQAHQNARFSSNRWLFYWVLVRHKLPHMWRYFSACADAEEVRQDDISSLGQSILVRCTRAVEARDAIGAQFYIPQDNDVRDVIMYHFDYLTLLLAGAFDAQARVARRAYGIGRPNERNISFRRPVRKPEFLDSLRDNGAANLYKLVSEQYFQDIMTLFYELRHTIHGAGLQVSAHCAGTRPEESFITVLPEYSAKLWQAAERCGSPEKWGLMRIHEEVLLDPYTYAVNLVNECLTQIDLVADATDVTKLFPCGYEISTLMDKPPEDDVFGERIRKRLAILG